MGRSIIFNPLTTSRPLDVRATPQASSSKLSKADLEARLRQKRSANYIRTMTQLDAGCHCQDPRAVEALITAIQQELPEVTIDKLPIGIVSRCFLGEDYEVHTLDRTGGIVQHYRRHQSLPPLLERARSLALHSEYLFVEVYVDSLVAVRSNGDTSYINQ
jgi:hypothetical protein